jgi:hypothetical protein
MLGIIMGRGGLDDLGATLWGQTELSVYDDSMHGIWGLSYKYNERAIVYNEKNLIRVWDCAYDGYNGGKDCRCVEWNSEESVLDFQRDTYELNQPYEGASMMVMAFTDVKCGDVWPSPIIFHDDVDNKDPVFPVDGEHANPINCKNFRVFNKTDYKDEYKAYYDKMPNFTHLHNTKQAGLGAQENETSACSLAFQGSHKVCFLCPPLAISVVLRYPP